MRIALAVLGVAGLALSLVPSAWADVPPVSPAETPAGASNICGGTGPVRPQPVAATHKTPPYPAESQRLGEKGTSMLMLQVGPDGAVVSDTIVNSSGSERLDEAALDYVKQNWRWEPLNCARPVAIRVSVAWALQPPNPFLADPSLIAKIITFVAAGADDFPAGVTPHKAMGLFLVIIAPDGAVASVVPLRGTGDAALDAKSVDLVKNRHHWTAPQMDGKPAGAMNFIGVLWTPPGETPPDTEAMRNLLQFFAPSPASASWAPPAPPPPPK